MNGYQNKTFWVHLVEILHNKNKLKDHHFWIMVFFGNSGKKKNKKKTGKFSPLKAVQRHNRLFNLENMYFVQVSRHYIGPWLSHNQCQKKCLPDSFSFFICLLLFSHFHFVPLEAVQMKQCNHAQKEEVNIMSTCVKSNQRQ